MSEKAIRNLRKRHAKNKDFHHEFINDTYSIVRNLAFPSMPLASDRVAVIIEPRPHPHLEYVIKNIMHFLGDGWGLQIIGSRSNEKFLNEILADCPNAYVRILDVENLTRLEFREMRKDSKYWQSLQGKQLLCFETDTLLCRPGIEAFLEYDYIGAPWKAIQAVSDVVRVGNGGLSLRSKQAMIDMCLRGKTHAIPSEDTYFSVQLHLHKDEYKLPSVEVAKQFSVETLYYQTPLGFYKFWN